MFFFKKIKIFDNSKLLFFELRANFLMSFDLKCPIPDHHNDPLILVCFDERCQNKGRIINS